ncbi:hypothetical protein D3C72_769820 [compost metagenome]
MGHGVAVEHGQAEPETQGGPQAVQRQHQQADGILSMGMLHQPRGHDRARDDGEQDEGGQGDQEGQHVELEEAVRLRLVVDQVQTRQQGLETTVCSIGADHQRQGALSRHRASRGVRQPVDLVQEDGARGVRHDIGQGRSLFADLPNGQDDLVEADQDGDGGKDRQQGEEGDAARIEHDVAPPAAGEGANRQLAPEQGQGRQSGLWVQARASAVVKATD